MALTQVPPALLTSTTGTGSTVVLSTAPTISGDLTVTGTMVMGSSFMRNRIINGDMRIDQRNAGASGTANNYTVDRWQYYGTQASKVTWQQNAGSVTPPAGLTNYLGFTSSSTYSVLSTDIFEIYQPIEGLNVADLDFGKATAKTITLSFWVRSSLTGTFGGGIGNATNTRNYPFTYTISLANTWEQKTITIAGDTTGTWGTGNGLGIAVVFGLGAGSSFLATANSWNGTTNATLPTGATNVVSTNGATFYITGVQLEIGSSATPFERRLYGQELANCQRYCNYMRLGDGVVGACVGTGIATTATSSILATPFPVVMRATPTVSFSGLNVTDGVSYNLACSSLGALFLCPSGARFFLNHASGATTRFPEQLTIASTTDYLAFSAEL